MFLPTRLL